MFLQTVDLICNYRDSYGRRCFCLLDLRFVRRAVRPACWLFELYGSLNRTTRKSSRFLPYKDQNQQTKPYNSRFQQKPGRPYRITRNLNKIWRPAPYNSQSQQNHVLEMPRVTSSRGTVRIVTNERASSCPRTPARWRCVPKGHRQWCARARARLRGIQASCSLGV